MITKRFFVLFILLLFLTPFVFAKMHAERLDLPSGLQQIESYNKEVANQYLTTATIFIAFLAGILTLLSPCILPILPAFFSYTFVTKRNVMKMTLIFFLGFALMFTTIALAAVFVGVSSTVILQLENLSIYTRIIGALLVLVGLAGVLGLGFNGAPVKRKLPSTSLGIFLYGLLFAVGWTVCVGPILSGVILMASLFQNYAMAASLIIAYSFGMFLPLFILSLLWDKFSLGDGFRWLRGKLFSYKLFGKEHRVHTSNLIAGSLFLLIGLLFLITGGTAVVNTFDPLGTKMLFYQWQPLLLENAGLFNAIGIAALLFTLLVIVWGLRPVKKIK